MKSLTLEPGEKVACETGLHWIIFAWPAVVGAIFLAPIAVALLYDRNIRPILKTAIDATALVFVPCMMQYSHSRFVVTDKRVILEHGVFWRSSIEFPLAELESVAAEQGAVGGLLGSGSLVVRRTGGKPRTFRNVRNPAEFAGKARERRGKT
jgi:membrane protein YdbS with pleckstrin-like domain